MTDRDGKPSSGADDDDLIPEETPGKPGGDKMTTGRPRGSMLLALAIGAVGGLVFAWAQLPLPWMMGAMVATTVASVAGANIRIDFRLRTAMIAILGVMLGSAFRPELIDRAGEWAVSIAGLLVYAITAGALVTWYFRKVGGYDAVTSYFASSPGGLNEMVLVGRAMGGDDRVIALTHSARILLVVMTIPFVFRIFADYTPSGTLLPPGGGLDMALQDWAILGGCAVGRRAARQAAAHPGLVPGRADGGVGHHPPGRRHRGEPAESAGRLRPGGDGHRHRLPLRRHAGARDLPDREDLHRLDDHPDGVRRAVRPGVGAGHRRALVRAGPGLRPGRPGGR